ncbi:MAG: ribosome-associated translation inhibitor RaiA [Spirosomaceae bacterium]|jgi:putative sigma-54 modulation protein|nr:ribosome-associated translation inhibitor RaiA [Spirosomataceae bacterium]
MKVNVHAVHFDADNSLVEFVKRKLEKLETFYDRITSAEVFLKTDKGDSNKIQTKLIEVNINVPGQTLFVKEKGKTFEEATDIAMDALKSQIKKFKDKKNEIEHRKPEMAVIEEEEEVFE